MINKKFHIGAKIINPGSSHDYHTGSWRHQIPIINKSKCKNCFTCVLFCPENCIKVKDDKISNIDFKYCKGCGLCAKECPAKAIIMKKE